MIGVLIFSVSVVVFLLWAIWSCWESCGNIRFSFVYLNTCAGPWVQSSSRVLAAAATLLRHGCLMAASWLQQAADTDTDTDTHIVNCKLRITNSDATRERSTSCRVQIELSLRYSKKEIHTDTYIIYVFSINCRHLLCLLFLVASSLWQFANLPHFVLPMRHGANFHGRYTKLGSDLKWQRYELAVIRFCASGA